MSWLDILVNSTVIAFGVFWTTFGVQVILALWVNK